MRLKHQLFILFVASVLQIPFSPVHAEDNDHGFMVKVRTDKGEIPVRFFVNNENRGCLGYGKYNHPIIPNDMTGEIFIPDSITTPDGQRLDVYAITRGAFQGCRNIGKIHLPNTIQYISDYSFEDCSSLREISLPYSLKVIYPMAFKGCNALQRVIMKNPEPPYVYVEGVFDEKLIPTLTIICPKVSDAYQKHWYFCKCRYYMELMPLYSEQKP